MDERQEATRSLLQYNRRHHLSANARVLTRETVQLSTTQMPPARANGTPGTGKGFGRDERPIQAQGNAWGDTTQHKHKHETTTHGNKDTTQRTTRRTTQTTQTTHTGERNDTGPPHRGPV